MTTEVFCICWLPFYLSLVEPEKYRDQGKLGLAGVRLITPQNRRSKTNPKINLCRLYSVVKISVRALNST